MRRSEHVTLLLPTDIGGSGGLIRSGRRSWFRFWNQRTRLQRSLTLLFVFVLVTAGTWLTILNGETWWPANRTPPRTNIQHNNGEQLDDNPSLHRVDMQAAVAIAAAPVIAMPQHHRLAPDDSPPQVGDGVGVAPQPYVLPEPLQKNQQQQQPPPADEQPHEQPNLHQRYPESLPQEANRIDDIVVKVAAAEELLDGQKDFKGATNERQKAVVAAFRHAWNGYKEFAWGHDNLKPISMAAHDWFGLGLTIVDALDTMYIMDLRDDFDEARDWVDQHLHFDVSRDVNLFEVTIRVLGGLMSAYHLSGDKMFLDKAIDLAGRLMPCFASPSGIPYSDVNLATLNAHSPKWSPDSSTSEVTTIQLEFRDLTRSTGNQKYAESVDRINRIVHGLEKQDGLVPIFINANTGTFRSFATVSLGARGDSYYEYLLKQWLQSGQRADDEFLIDDYRTAIDGVLSNLVRSTPREHHVYVGELINGKDFKPKMDHLTCYLPGTLLLGHQHAGQPAEHRRLAEDLLETCFQTYMKQPTQLAPEITYFNLNGESESDMYVKTNDAHNLLRPEFVESLYYFYALTGNATYQDMGWRVFEAFERNTRVRAGYTSIGNVKNVLNTRPRDMMESFFLGETLKYFYLLFGDDRREVDLERFVFNTEAHLVPIWGKE